MKKTSTALLALALLSQNLMAAQVRVVSRYADTFQVGIWNRVENDSVPEALIERKTITDPTHPYASVFPRAFYQEENFVVCHRDCNQADASSGKEQLEQQTVYFWLARFYAFIGDRFNLSPQGRIRVMTDRRVSLPGGPKTMRNNAFFNPTDGTLSFLPATANPLMRLLTGRINRSGFDPSVIAHEAGHSIFHAIFPNYLNDEISGLNEGIADYLSNILLDQGSVGAVMLRGRALRNSDSHIDSDQAPKIYQPGLEAHDLGERVAAALWQTRRLVSDKTNYDRLVMDALEDLSSNPFATVHGFKEKMLERIDALLSAQEKNQAEIIFETFLAGVDSSYRDTRFLSMPLAQELSFRFTSGNEVSRRVSDQFGVASSLNQVSIYRQEATTDGLIAAQIGLKLNTDPEVRFSVLVDNLRSNILGVWDSRGQLVTDSRLETLIKPHVTTIVKPAVAMSGLVKSISTMLQLRRNSGELALAYRVANQRESSGRMNYNGTSSSTRLIRMQLNRRLVALALGAAVIKSVTFTVVRGAPLPEENWPAIDGEPVVGITTELEDGNTTTQLLEANR